jgi:hypothetical protein
MTRTEGFTTMDEHVPGQTGRVRGTLFRRHCAPVSITLTAHGGATTTPASFELHDLDLPLHPGEIIVVQCQGGGVFKCRRSLGHANRCEVIATRPDTDVESCWADGDT